LGSALCESAKALPQLHSLRLTLADDPDPMAALDSLQLSSGGVASRAKPPKKPLNALGFLRQATKI